MQHPDFTHILTHLDEERATYRHAMTPPIYQTSNFAYPHVEAFRNALRDELENPIYTRGNNPTVELLRRKLAAMEGAEDALVFGSGSAAVANAVLSQVKAGDHILCVDKPYSWTNKLLTQFLARFGVEYSFVDARNMTDIQTALRPNTRLMILESPNSLTFELQDLAACAALAKQHGIVTMVDNSYATPYFQRPIDLGIDIVVYSGTKYYNGHSDVVVGVVCSSAAIIRQMFSHEFMTLGAILSPHDAWLVLRGLRTFSLRIQRSADTAHYLAQWLEQQPQVERVLYVGLPSFPQYDLARQQMRGASGLFAIYLRCQDQHQIEAFCNAIADTFLLAVSWGGYESLMIPSCLWHLPQGNSTTHLPVNFIRFYAGLESVEYLQNAFVRGFAALEG